MTSQFSVGVASFGCSLLLFGCGGAPEPVVAELPDVAGPPNIVLIVSDEPTRSSASAHSALLLGMHLAAGGSDTVGVKVFPEYLRRAGYYTVRSGDARHDLSVQPAGATPSGDLGQPGLLGAWDAAGSGVDWRKAPGEPCTVSFGCGGYAAESGLPFFALFNVSTAEATDHVVGRILTKLEADGLKEDTVVLAFRMDGGDTSAILWWPDQLEPGTTRDSEMSVLDVAPTVLSLAGVPVPSHMPGRVVVGLEAVPATSAEHAAHSKARSSADVWPDGGPTVAATPSGYPTGGLFHVAPRVELGCETEGSSIIYTTEREPPYHWRLYTGSFRMRFWTLRFQCGRLGHLDSEVVTYDFDIE